MQPIDFYRELLLSTGIKENQDGIGFVTEGSSVPLTVKKKVLVLPTEEIQANYNNSQDDIQVFHPACENVMRKDSEETLPCIIIHRFTAIDVRLSRVLCR